MEPNQPVTYPPVPAFPPDEQIYIETDDRYSESFRVGAQPVESQRSPTIVGVRWGVFLLWLRDAWEPGTHLAIVGPTGEGKTTFVVGILGLRKWVLALDPKGEDETLAASGYQRVTSFPLPSSLRNSIARGEPARLIIGGPSRTDEERKHLRRLMAEALKMAREQGGWTVYVDEFQILSDARMFGLGKQVEELLIAARRNRSSVVTSFQAPAWVPRAATRQAWGTLLLPTRDVNMIKAVAESMGRPWQELQRAVHSLPRFHGLFIPKSIHAPMILINPPKVD
jgi:hypothetical protein